MAVLVAAFFAEKYWKDTEEINSVFDRIREEMIPAEAIKIVNGDLSGLNGYSEEDTLVIVPCSGSVQPEIAEVSRRFRRKVIFVPYIEGNFEAEITDKMLYCSRQI